MDMIKIGKLLNKAENAATPEEAAAYVGKAQFLAAKYSVDLAVARAAVAKGMKREEPTSRRIEVAEYRSKTKKWMVELFLSIGRANDLRTDIGGGSTSVIPYGFASDIDVAEALFASLSIQMVEQANEWLAKGEYKNETQRKWDEKTWQWIEKPIDGRVARASFYQTFIIEVGRRLRAAKAEVESVAVAESTGTDLVLVAKRDEVQDFYRKKSTARGSWKSSGSNGYSSSASSAGRTAGASAKISGSKSVGGNRKQIGA